MEEGPPRVRLWHRLAGRSRAPGAASTAMLLAVLGLAAVTQAGAWFHGRLGLSTSFILAGWSRDTLALLELASFGLGLALGAAASALIGAPVVVSAASVLLAVMIPVDLLGFLTIGTTTAGGFHPAFAATGALWVAAGGASSAASWALVTVPWARRDRVPAWPWPLAAGAALTAPAVQWLDGMVPIAMTGLSPFLVVPVLAGALGWLAWGWDAEDPAPPRPFEPGALGPVGLLLAGSAPCWLGLFVWTDRLDPIDRVVAGDVQAVRAILAIWCAALWTLGFAWRPQVSSLAWAGRGFLLAAAAVAVSNTPWFAAPSGRVAVLVLFEAGAVVVVAMVVRKLVEDLPPGVLPLALGAWLAIVATHGMPPWWVLGAMGHPSWDLQGPLAIGCAVWGGLLLLAARVGAGAGADRIASSGLPAEPAER